MFTKNQFITSLTVCYLGLISSAQLTWPTALVELFQSKDTPLHRPASTTEVAFVGSLSNIGTMLGMPLFAFLFDKIGRKKTTVSAGIPLVIAWASLASTDRVEAVLVALLMSGTAVGGFIVALAFVVEISELRYRGTLTGIPAVGYSLGVLLAYALGGYLSYWTVIYVHLSLSILYLLFAQMTEESPVYLLKKNDEAGALKALAYYRSLPLNDKVLLDEFYLIKQSINMVDEDSNLGDVNSQELREHERLKEGDDDVMNTLQKQSAFSALAHSPRALRALLFCLLLMSGSIFMGMMSVMVYAETLFKASAPSISSTVCSILLAVSMILSGLFGTAFSDKLGRRKMMISSSALSGLCVLALGVQLHTAWGPAWLAVLLVLLYTFVFNFGAGIIPFFIMGEIFNAKIRALCTTLILETSCLLNFLLLFIFGWMVQLLSLHGVFYFFSAICGITMTYAVFQMPETKGLTPNEVEKFFAGRRKHYYSKKRKNTIPE